MKQIFAIVGSADKNSSNFQLLRRISELAKNSFHVTIFNKLSELPHFDPELSIENPPQSIVNFRTNISNADGIIICTPEYVFSIPSGLKNAIEWCVATTVFSHKPVGIITAAASGQKGHDELKLIMMTIEAIISDETCLLISGIKGKLNKEGHIIDEKTLITLQKFVESYDKFVNSI